MFNFEEIRAIFLFIIYFVPQRKGVQTHTRTEVISD